MASRIFEKVAIRGISASVPDKILRNETISGDKAEVHKVAKTIGILKRHIADATLCTSDLCYEAANQLLKHLDWEKNSVDALIFVSQTPDYVLPATSCVLQNRLGLSTHCATFDINLGCSGYIYGLLSAFSLISETGIKRVLLLVGDTVSKMVSPNDIPANILFGDAGTATAIEFDSEAEASYFILGTDGSGEKSLIVEAGGFRKPTSEQTKIRKNHPKDQIIRSDEELFIDGSAVFSFTLQRVPETIHHLLNLANQPLSKIDGWLFHQANKFMLDYLGQKTHIDADKIWINIEEYGNTSSASIPLLMVTHGKKNGLDNQIKNIGMMGFGVGLSWGAALIQMNNIVLPDVIFVASKEC